MTETRYKQLAEIAFEFKNEEAIRTAYISYEKARDKTLDNYLLKKLDKK